MKTLYSKIIITFAVTLSIFFFSSSVFANERGDVFQMGIYSGVATDSDVAASSGLHSALGLNSPLVGEAIDADLIDAHVHGVKINQNVILGVNGRYYPSRFIYKNGFEIGIDFDFSFSDLKMPAQTVTLDGMGEAKAKLAAAGVPSPLLEGTRPDLLPQPKSDMDLFSLSIGPIFRYKDSGTFAKFNPYISPSISFHYGTARGVNYGSYNIATTYAAGKTYFYPDPEYYGKRDTSQVDGIGYGVKIGAEYFAKDTDKFGFSMEFRYTNNALTVDHFRSFTRGLDIEIETMSVLFTTMWRSL